MPVGPVRECPWCGQQIRLCRDCEMEPIHGRGRLYCESCGRTRRELAVKQRDQAYNNTPYRRMYKKLHLKYRRGLLTDKEFKMLKDTYKLAYQAKP